MATKKASSRRHSKSSESYTSTSETPFLEEPNLDHVRKARAARFDAPRVAKGSGAKTSSASSSSKLTEKKVTASKGESRKVLKPDSGYYYTEERVPVKGAEKRPRKSKTRDSIGEQSKKSSRATKSEPHEEDEYVYGRREEKLPASSERANKEERGSGSMASRRQPSQPSTTYSSTREKPSLHRSATVGAVPSLRFQTRHKDDTTRCVIRQESCDCFPLLDYEPYRQLFAYIRSNNAQKLNSVAF
jgi:hypothetical protein